MCVWHLLVLVFGRHNKPEDIDAPYSGLSSLSHRMRRRLPKDSTLEAFKQILVVLYFQYERTNDNEMREAKMKVIT